MNRPGRAILWGAIAMLAGHVLPAEDGYRLWMRYDLLPAELRAEYATVLKRVTFSLPSSGNSAVVAAARKELATGLYGLLGVSPEINLAQGTYDASLGGEGYRISTTSCSNCSCVTIAANSEAGILYAAFAVLRGIQTQSPLQELFGVSVPRIDHRLLNHWDNLDRTVERGTAGFSLWEWFQLPDYVSPRYTDYARACASVGINGTVLTNVNANALILTPDYLAKVRAIADVFRSYNLKVYLTARFSAPMEIGGLDTADPLDPRVRAWWKEKVNEVYRYIPDFGGFLVKANSEGQPGPQDYGRNHADGANMLADALAPHGGIVMWRAFVYSADIKEDRAKQAYAQFKPLDGQFRDNVVVQVKNGPIDFMPREPFHPLFGAVPQTNLGMEFQITQEYLGASIHLAYLGPLYEEVLDADTHANGPGSTVARVIDGSLQGQSLSVIAGVANTGNVRNWTGHPMAQANWYGYGRLAWDHQLDSRVIAAEWTRMTFGNDHELVDRVVNMLMESREAVVNYYMPIGLHHIMAWGHHYGPGPWVSEGRPDWTSVYYHKAGPDGVGFDRTVSGSNALSQYAPELQEQWGSIETIPLELLLWFHHVPWDYTLLNGQTLWESMARHYQQGVDTARSWLPLWGALEGKIDPQRWSHVQSLLVRQAREAQQWKDACLLYFQQFSGMPFPEGVEPAEHDLDYYKAIQYPHFPGDPAG